MMIDPAPREVDQRTSARTVEMAWLKTRLLAHGLRILGDPASVTIGGKPMLRVRSGSCGGLDIILPDGTWVNAPVRERFARTSPLTLRTESGALVLNDGDTDIPVRLVPTPAYYAQASSDGQPMRRVGQLCSDRLGIGLTNACTFFRSKATRCRFCSIGANLAHEQRHKAVSDVIETVLAAVHDPVAPARHVLLGGGTPNVDDAGAVEVARVAAAIKAVCDVSIYAMIAPPRDPAYLELLADSGVDELGMNIEVFTESAAKRFIPGKHAALSLEQYWRALDRAVEVFGPINTRSITVVGLESASETIEGVERLASIGVMPILSPLRPLNGTLLEQHPRLSPDALWEITVAATEAAARHDVPLGPLCIACQSNTLAIPGDRRYRLY